jgi:CRISPR-associated protein Cmr5
VNVRTTSQKMAQRAYERIADRKPDEKYASFAREFPTLVHSCGLAQALAFARAKGERSEHHKKYADDLAKVLTAAGHEQVRTAKDLADRTRDLPVTQYIRLSRDALAAAVWLKRYVEATGDGPTLDQGE